MDNLAPTYFDSARGVVITRERALEEITRHGYEYYWEEFLSEVGDYSSYHAEDVLLWIGY